MSIRWYWSDRASFYATRQWSPTQSLARFAVRGWWAP